MIKKGLSVLGNKFILSEVKKLSISLVIAVIVFQIPFYKESFFNIIKIILSFYWLFVIPGHMILLNFRDIFDFKIRFILGITLGLGIYGILSYYIGLMGIHAKYHWAIVPALIIIGSIIFLKIKNPNNKG